MPILVTYEGLREKTQKWEWFFGGAYNKVEKAIDAVSRLMKDANNDPSFIRSIRIDYYRAPT